MSKDVNRREFLRSVVVSAGGVALGAAMTRCAEDVARILDGRSFFPQSVASGDPSPQSVILWTRVEDAAATGDVSLTLQVSRDRAFTQIVVNRTGLVARAAHDHCLKVKVIRLDAQTTYYYRFLYAKGTQTYGSQVGRTKTAPAAGADVPVRFAVVNCQDFIGRYYNSYIKLADDANLDFVLHVGDYIYETNGDPSFQNVTSDRAITFDDEEGAIALVEGTETFYAAASLDNYRQLYRVYRSDPMLQRAHERFPFIVIWDDHEFSNDSHGASGTYRNGRASELSEERKRNAERAFFEYQPVDDADVVEGAIETPDEKLFPATRLYRHRVFGKHLHLVLTDYRTFRPDHLIPEDAFPGTVILSRAVLTGLGIYEQFASTETFGYVNIDEPSHAQRKAVLTGVLTQAYVQEGLSPTDASAKAQAVVQGNLSALVANGLLARYNEQVPASQRVELISTGGLDRGLAYIHLGKQGLFSSLGSRYFVIKDSFDLVSAVRYSATTKASENAWGDDQEAFVRSTLMGSTATWKVLASSVSFTPMVIDLRNNPLVPSQLRTRFYLNVDQWDGFPNKKRELLDFLGTIPNAVIVSGDIHASFVTEHPVTGRTNKVVEFTAPAISSESLQDLALNLVLGDPTLSQVPGITTLVASLADFLRGGAPGLLRYLSLNANGYAVLEAGPDALTAEYHLIDTKEVTTSYYGNPDGARGKFLTLRFTARGGALA
jgi:alkaline phosphatase D